MRVNIQEMLKDCGLDETLYPGKRVVWKLPQPGENKSHCVVYDWRAPETLRVEVRAGLSGKAMPPRDLQKFPISFQAPTYFEIGVSADQAEEAEEEDGEQEEGEQGSRTGGSGGGRKMAAGKSSAFSAFAKMVEGKVPNAGDIKKLVVMGKEIARDAYESVIGILKAQIKSMAVVPVNILAAAQAVKITKATPGGGLAPNGDEDVKYRYKGAEMFGLVKT